MDKENTARVMGDLPRDFWAIECITHDGIAQTLIDECRQYSQHWTGWTFLTNGSPEPFKHVTYYESVPVLLFEDEQDAFCAELRYGTGKGLNTSEQGLVS